MSQLGLILQESLHTDQEERTILSLLTQQTDSTTNHIDNPPRRRRRTFKERLRFTRITCCGTTWGFPSTQEDQEDEARPEDSSPAQRPDPNCIGPAHVGPGMNLAAALAAERQFRGTAERETAVGRGDGPNGPIGPGTPWRVSLMRLLEEGEGGDVAKTVTVTEEERVGNDRVCCVCMGRKKGAAFIPCGHTFCRVCSRELWLNRGTCPLCNRSILEILDIF